MTYAMNLNNVGFAELTHDEMMCVDGGGWLAGITVAALTVTGVVLAIVAPPAGAGVLYYTGVAFAGLGGVAGTVGAWNAK